MGCLEAIQGRMDPGVEGQNSLKLGNGIAPDVQLKKRGVNVALGTDGGDTSDSYSIFEQMKLAALLSRLSRKMHRRYSRIKESSRRLEDSVHRLYQTADRSENPGRHGDP